MHRFPLAVFPVSTLDEGLTAIVYIYYYCRAYP